MTTRQPIDRPKTGRRDFLKIGAAAAASYGIAAPAKLPKSVLTRLHTEIIRINKQPDVRERILSDGSEPVGSSPEEFRKYMIADLAKWAKFVKESGAKFN